MVNTRKIFFGHQSVGQNIVDGIVELDDKISVTETRQNILCYGTCIFHCKIGQNRDPNSKIEDFANIITKSLGNQVHIAGFKFCYIDIDRAKDIDSLFDKYYNTIQYLQNKFSQTRFFHTTVPLRTDVHGIKAFVGKFLGKKSLETLNNSKREEFNTLLRARYAESNILFDLAKIESTHPSGNRTFTKQGNKPVYYLAPEFTNDGGHLNQSGRFQVATEFLNSVVNAKL